MTIREQLLGISELNINKKLINMNDNQLDEYIRKLKSFAENFPAKEANLKNAFEKKDYDSFSEGFASLRDMLMYIQADDLAAECLKLIDELVVAKYEKVEAHMTYLLSLLTMLSIDIQMAVYKDEYSQQSSSSATQSQVPETSAQEQHRTENRSEALQCPAKEGNILAVDDNAFFLDILKKALQNTGYRLTCVNSGIAALKFLEIHTPDLFILDIEMPEMDGYELARKIRACGKNAPILFLTGNATIEYVAKSIKAGAADFIVKPITQKQVLERIAKFI